MNSTELDQCYSALCETMAELGADRAPLFLAMMCLSLMSRTGSAADVLPLIEQARRQCEAGGASLLAARDEAPAA